jgi:hypothetical protein
MSQADMKDVAFALDSLFSLTLMSKLPIENPWIAGAGIAGAALNVGLLIRWIEKTYGQSHE